MDIEDDNPGEKIDNWIKTLNELIKWAKEDHNKRLSRK